MAHEAVYEYREPTQPNPGYNKADLVILVRPKDKKADAYKKILLEKFFQQCQDIILYVYLNVGAGRVGIDVFYE